MSMMNIMISKKNLLLFSLVVAIAPPALALEDTKIMPVGIRRVSLRTLGTVINKKTDADGVKQDLSKPLEKDLTFNDVLKSEKDPLKKQLSTGFLLYEKFNLTDSVGDFKADLSGRVTVFAPIVTYGLTSKVTIAAAMPIYNMAMTPSVAFNANALGSRFLSTLANSYNNQTEAARDAGGKINDAVGQLNKKLSDNGYRPIANWKVAGLGDLQVLSKIQVLDARFVKSAVTAGAVAPTGRVGDPDNLIDKGFGDGQWDLFAGLAGDEPIGATGFFVNQYVKYTAQLPGKKTVRLITEDEPIEVPKGSVHFKLGDKLETGASLQYANATSGIGGGIGYNYYNKWKDLYRNAGISKVTLEKNTFECMHQAEFELSYSSVPAFLRKEIVLPFETKLNYKRHLASKNMAVTDFLQLEAGVFF